MESAMTGLVSTAWLADRLGDPSVRIVDVRWYLDPTRQGSDAYAAGHIPAAVFLDVDADLAAPTGGRGRPLGRHPWPSSEQVERVMSHVGVGPGTTVIAYDDQAGAVAARLWFLLRAHGHDEAAVLDGGLGKWLAEGRPVTATVPEVAPTTFVARLRPGLVVTKEEMIARDTASLVLDARAAERYRGEVEPIDPRAGHIPGAKNAPFTGNLTGGPTSIFLSPDALHRRYADLGAEGRDVIVYCGSGVTACHDLLALHLAGFEGRLYAGSWSEWSADPILPTATGENSREVI
jgi:thiosulfate/3-mercaptopyruvate sulfurtransferase